MMMLGNHAENSTWMADALAVPGGTDADLRLVASALYALNTAATGATDGEVEAGMRDLRELAHQLGGIDVNSSPLMGLLRTAVAFFAADLALTERYIAEALQAEDAWARAAVRMLSANLAENEGDLDRMRIETETALAEFRVLGERWGLAGTLRSLAQLHTLDGRLDEAVAAYEEALSLSAELNSREDEGFLLGRLADIEMRRGNLEAARRLIAHARSTAEEHGAPIESVFTLAMLAAVEQQSGNIGEARALQSEAMRRIAGLPREHPAQGHIRAILLAVATRVAFHDDTLDDARDFARESYDAALGTRDLPVIAAVGVTIAELAHLDGRHVDAATMLGAAARLRGAEDPTAREIASLTERLRAELGDAGFDRCYEQGRALDREAALERLSPG
jgi:tetratricopeptide (TPR) repeat protein